MHLVTITKEHTAYIITSKVQQNEMQRYILCYIKYEINNKDTLEL